MERLVDVKVEFSGSMGGMAGGWEIEIIGDTEEVSTENDAVTLEMLGVRIVVCDEVKVRDCGTFEEFIGRLVIIEDREPVVFKLDMEPLDT